MTTPPDLTVTPTTAAPWTVRAVRWMRVFLTAVAAVFALVSALCATWHRQEPAVFAGCAAGMALMAALAIRTPLSRENT
jgi:hypothetical protein